MIAERYNYVCIVIVEEAAVIRERIEQIRTVWEQLTQMV